MPAPATPISDACPPSADPPRPARAPYEAPVIAPLGAWVTATLLLSVPIGPGSPLGSLFTRTED